MSGQPPRRSLLQVVDTSMLVKSVASRKSVLNQIIEKPIQSGRNSVRRGKDDRRKSAAAIGSKPSYL